MPKHASISGPRSATARFAGLLLLGAVLGVALGAHVAAADTGHVVTFVNRCKEPIWLAEFASTSVAPASWSLGPTCSRATRQMCPSKRCKKGTCYCSSDADCSFGGDPSTQGTCDVASHRCAKRATITVPAGWAGRFWPRTGCSGSSSAFVCETGQCGPPTGGDIDCTAQNASGNLATLFELNAAANDGADNFDVSLVSGYNVPVSVKVALPADAAQWQPNTLYVSGAQIIEKVGKSVFGFTNGGATGTSGSTEPVFPDTWTDTVNDGPDVLWANTGPACETSGCTRRGIRPESCPSVLQVPTQSGRVACDVPANVCSLPGALCAADLAYYQCQNNGGETDLFSKVIGLQSPNAESFVCFSAEDCPHGTSCQLDPAFAGGAYALPTGAGVCTPVPQNGGCGALNDGDPCAHYPFVEYTCQTMTSGSTKVCVPPVTSGMGNLWWNAVNWTQTPPPGPSPAPTSGPSPSPSPAPTPQSCMLDTDCGAAAQKCLTPPPTPVASPTPDGQTPSGLQQCPPGAGSCTCWYPQTCTAATCPGANQCLNVDGVPDGKMDGGNVVDCATETCYCGPQGVYSGTCGPTNPGWTAAAANISDAGASWPQDFKRGCPIAYAYQYDDPSSNWSCENPSVGLNGYRVIFCGAAGR